MTQKEEKENETALTLAHYDYRKGLNAYAFYKLHDHTTGEDLVQDTFMKTWVYLVKGGKINTMRAFLYHVLNHLIVDEYRKNKNTTSLDVLLEKGFELSSNDSDRLFNILDGKAVFLLIDELPEKYQKIMRMRYIQDLSLHEISLITGQSKNAIAVQTHRGLEKLKVLYNHNKQIK